MRLIFIRHGDPDYQNDNLTEKGKREIELLTKRVCSWKNIKAFYSSPLGRARATGEPALQILDREAIVYPWLQEFHYITEYPEHYFKKSLSGKKTMCWDLLPEIFYSDKKHFDKDNWFNAAIFKKGKIKEHFKEVTAGIDGLLSEYGYVRNKQGFYTVSNPVYNPNFDSKYEKSLQGSVGISRNEKYQLVAEKNTEEECTLVFFCHLGVMFAIISHLINISPMQLWQGFYVAPSSVTVLNTEERIKGQAVFRVERLGDTNHLISGGEKISSSGYFSDVLQETK